jgi:hypothetical protein
MAIAIAPPLLNAPPISAQRPSISPMTMACVVFARLSGNA